MCVLFDLVVMLEEVVCQDVGYYCFIDWNCMNVYVWVVLFFGYDIDFFVLMGDGFVFCQDGRCWFYGKVYDQWIVIGNFVQNIVGVVS